MSRSSTARIMVAAGAFVAGVTSLRRRRRLQRGGPMQNVKEIARRLTEDPWRGKLDEALELVGSDYVGHIPGAPEPIHGTDGFRDFVNMYLTGFPDGTITVDDQIAEGELVATRWTARGTHTGELMGMPPTGKQVTVSGITYARIADGRAREAWLSWDTLSMMQQLGAVPEAAPARTT
jgi:steroid delta-isomerase-like uncharacterized protein